MSYQVVLTNQAKADLISIYQYIAYDLQSPDTAECQLSRLEKAIASLDQMPERYLRFMIVPAVTALCVNTTVAGRTESVPAAPLVEPIGSR